MRKSIWTVLFTALVALVAVSCAKETDLTDVKNKINELDQRVTALEQAVEKINKETVPGFENLVKALNEKLTVVSVVESEDGVVINFSDGTSSTITNGKDGKDGADGKDGENGKDGVDGKDGENGKDAQAPEINITLIDGVYYWTVNGELLKDGDGNPIPVSTPGPKGDQGDKGDKGDKGDQGEQGITPLFGTSSEGKVIVSYDNGETWKPLGFSVIDGSAFTSAYIDDNKSTDDYIVLVVGETEVQIPKEKNFSLVIKYEGDLSAVGANAGDNIAIEYEVEGASEADKVTVDVLSATAGITATIQKVDALHGYILIGVPAAEPEAEPAKVSGKIFVFADNNKGKTNIKVISLEEGEISAVADVSAQVPAAGGEIPLTVTTNKEYNVNISDGATSWLHVVDTKATHVDELTIVADPNTSGAYRVGVVSINDRNSGELIEEFTVLQQPASDVATDLGSIRSLADETAVTGQKAIVLASSQYGALVGDANGAYIFLAKEGNTAVRGDEVSFAGVKNTTEVTNVIYVEASTLTVTASAQEVPDLPWQYIGYGEEVNSINTGSTGVLQKDPENGAYFISTPLIPCVYIETPIDIDLSTFEGKIVTIKGYTNGNFIELDDNWDLTEDSYYNFLVNSIEEVVFEVNPNWTLSYEGEYEFYGYTFEDILNTVSAGEDYYANYFMVPALYPVEQELTPAQIEALATIEALRVADDVQYSLTRYQETIEDEAANTTGSLYPEAATEYGKYLVFATGLTEEGYASGKYQYLIFEKKDPHIALNYEDFIGTWVVDNKIWEVEQKEAGVSYNVYADLMGLNTIALDGLFVDGKFAFMEKNIGAIGSYTDLFLTAESYSSADDFFGLGVHYDEPQAIFIVSALNDGTFEITPGTYDNGTKVYKFNYIELWDNAGDFTEVSYAKVPATIKPYVPSAATYEDFLGSFTVGSQVWTITQKVAGESYLVSGIPGPEGVPAVEALFDSEKKAFVLMEQDVPGTYQSQYGDVVDLILGGRFTYNSKQYWSYPINNAEPDVILTMSKEGDTYPMTAGLFQGQFVYQYGFHGTLSGGDYDGYSLNYTTYDVPAFASKAATSSVPSSISSCTASKQMSLTVNKVDLLPAKVGIAPVEKNGSFIKTRK